jgi:2-polyprenyl-6-methoxyphenol hydroxylase-like FAD-dependent oxidoreductase
MERYNILIIGAGVAGLTCASLLRKQGLNPVIIEKVDQDNFNNTGYMLGLLPLGGRVLTELDIEKDYFERSIEMKNYEIHKADGSLIKSYSLDFINKNYGSYRGIERRELIETLLKKLDRTRIRFGTTVKSIEQAANKVKVTLSGNNIEIFDLVIGADGLHSQTRNQLWDKSEYSFYDTEWGGWVSWLEKYKLNSYKEYWGASSFMGLYPVKNKTGVFLGGPKELTNKLDLNEFIENTKYQIKAENKLLHSALDSLKEVEEPYYWEFHDCTTDNWRKGNIILLGDSATGFLPTAGVGASMAMDSASAFVDELTKSDMRHIEYGLKLFEKRQKNRVEKAQKDSRKLAKLMFVKSHLFAAMRDYSIRFYSLKQLVSSISKTLEGE